MFTSNTALFGVTRKLPVSFDWLVFFVVAQFEYSHCNTIKSVKFRMQYCFLMLFL